MQSGRLNALLLAALPTGLHAQDIIVTGRGLNDAPGDAAYDIMTIDGARLNATASNRVEDAVRDVAGVAEFRRSDARSANPTSQGVTVRGLGGNAAARVLVLLDGIPQADPFAGYLEWPLYLPERLAQVRVTRGGGSGAGGAGALAGTIEFDSVGAADAPNAYAAIAGGSFAAVDAHALLAGRLGQGFATLSAGFAGGDGFVPIVTDQRGPADTDARYRQASLVARGVMPLSGGEVQGSIDLFDDQRTRGTAFSANRTTGADASMRLVGRRYVLLGYLQLRKFSSQFASVDVARTVATQTLDQFNTPATGLGLKGEVRPSLGSVELRLGAEWRHAAGRTEEAYAFAAASPTRMRTAGGQSDILGVFAEATGLAGPLIFTAGGRLDRWWLRDGERIDGPIGGTPTRLGFAPRADWQGSGRAGAAWTIGGGVTLSTAAYAGWRLPTLNELYRPFRVGIELTNPNAALRPERSRGFEAAIAWQPAADALIKATVFTTRLIDPIVNTTVTVTPTLITRVRQNAAELRSRGVELQATVRRHDWHATASVAYSDARLATAGSLDRLRPAGIAPFQISATLGWRMLSATARYSSAQFDDDQNSRRLAPAFTVDGVASVPLGDGVTLTLRGDNVFDSRVEAARSAAGVVERAAPRAVWLELRYTR